jgi:hypothetical protein
MMLVDGTALHQDVLVFCLLDPMSQRLAPYRVGQRPYFGIWYLVFGIIGFTAETTSLWSVSIIHSIW